MAPASKQQQVADYCGTGVKPRGDGGRLALLFRAVMESSEGPASSVSTVYPSPGRSHPNVSLTGSETHASPWAVFQENQPSSVRRSRHPSSAHAADCPGWSGLQRKLQEEESMTDVPLTQAVKSRGSGRRWSVWLMHISICSPDTITGHWNRVKNKAALNKCVIIAGHKRCTVFFK